MRANMHRVGLQPTSLVFERANTLRGLQCTNPLCSNYELFAPGRVVISFPTTYFSTTLLKCTNCHRRDDNHGWHIGKVGHEEIYFI
jgi:hypothetical protein